jgi:hypothetical protein
MYVAWFSGRRDRLRCDLGRMFKRREDHLRNRRAILLVSGGVCVLAMGAGLLAQSKPHVRIPVKAARPEDVASPESIVLADYASFSGGVGVPRDWGRDKSLMDPHARFVDVVTDPKTGAITAKSVDAQEFTDAADESMVKDGFEEHELAHVTHRYGNVATVLSSYEGKSQLTGKAASRGVNIYQVYFDGKRWWILSIVWEEERAGNPIPPELLPKR